MMVLLKARPGKEEEVRSALSAVVAPTRQEPGCLQYDLHVGVEEPGSFAFYERWRDQAAIDAHMKMPYVQSLFSRIPDLLGEPPVMKVLRLHG
jgi:quinol monooxygenase YgiN